MMKLPALGGLMRAARLPAAADPARVIEKALSDAAQRLPASLRPLIGPVLRTPGGHPARPAGDPSGPATSGPATSGELPGQFLSRRLGGDPQGRHYKLYVPSSYRGQAAPLLIMLHGCTQSADDFATGTAMNALAEEAGCLVAYPEQTASANAQRCWNWFNPADQARAEGEPALIAAITTEILREYKLDSSRVFVAGLSAGGAAAAIMAATYPDLYAGVGIHSGLACGIAHSTASAFMAMREGGNAPPLATRVPAIVFHGDRDTTVNPRNADILATQFAPPSGVTEQRSEGQSAGGREWERTTYLDRQGRVVLERWTVHGLGHAWSGGNKAGSYTDPKGPDASREMLRFFLGLRA